MTTPNAQPVLNAALDTLATCRLEGPAGRYRRNAGEDTGHSPAATAAAVNILYSLDRLPGDPRERTEWVESLQGLQNPETGLYQRDGRDSLSATAACVAALACLDSAPPHPPHAYLEFAESSALPDFFTQLNWCSEPTLAAREFGALYTVLTLAGKTDPDWRERWFRWIREEADEHTGLLRRECLAPIELDGQWTLLPYLSAYLYPLLTCLHARHPHPLPWRLVDTALEMMEFHRDLFFTRKGHRHLPWVLILSRSLRRTAHRHEEGMQALERFVPSYLGYLHDLIERDQYRKPVHIQWDIAVLAELQITLPGLVHTDRPLRQVLDRHSFLL